MIIDEQLQKQLMTIIQDSIIGLSVNNRVDELVLRKVTSDLLKDETISINWRASGVEPVELKKYPPIQFSNEFSTAEEMKKFCNMHMPVEIVQGFVNKDKDELTFVEGKALAFMICQLYKRFCI